MVGVPTDTCAQAMSANTSESADADTDDEAQDDEFTYYPQVTQHPTTIIEGDIAEIVTGADIDGDVEDTGSSFGVVFEDATVEGDGTIWQNRDIPEGFTSSAEFNDALKVAINGTDIDYIRGREVTEELVEESRERIANTLDAEGEFSDLDYDEHSVSGTDFKVADPTDGSADVQEVNGETLGIDVGGGVFSAEQVENFGDADRIMVWYGGMSGQFVGRGLDFNGMPFARYNVAEDEDDNDYLVKGLFQVPIGWRGDTDVEEYGEVPTTDRSKLATDLGRPPRVARPPVLRDDIDGRAFIAIGRYNGGQMHEVHIGRGADDYEDILELTRDGDLSDDDYDAIDMKYDQSPEERLSAEFNNPSEAYALYTGEGWQDEPEGADPFGSSTSAEGGSFDVDVEVDEDEVDHPTEQEVEFAEMVSEKIAGTGVSPDEEIFPVDDGKVDLEGLVGSNSGEFQVTPDVDAIRTVVYENTAHLNPDDL